MKAKLPLILRTLLGALFVFAGVMGLLNSTPPEGLPEALTQFNAGLAASKYFMPFLKITETLVGLMLLTGNFVPLALVILAPISLNIFFVHLFMAPSGVPLAVIIGLILIYLAFISKEYSPTIKQLFKRK